MLVQSDKLYYFQGQQNATHVRNYKDLQIHVINKLLKTKSEIPKLTSAYFLISFLPRYIRNQLKQQTQKAKADFFAFSLSLENHRRILHSHCRFNGKGCWRKV